jgi:putative transcriptional regulator
VPHTSRSSIYAKRVGESIRAARQSAGLTQAAVAQRMGVSAPYIVAVEAGRANPTVGQLAAFAEAMQLGLDVAFRPVPVEYTPGG